MRKLIGISILAALVTPALAENATIYVWPGDRIVKMVADHPMCIVTIHGYLNDARVSLEHCVFNESPMRGEIRFSDDP